MEMNQWQYFLYEKTEVKHEIVELWNNVSDWFHFIKNTDFGRYVNRGCCGMEVAEVVF